MKLSRSVLAFVVLTASAASVSHAQSGNSDGPITARAYDAAYVKAKLDGRLREEIAKLVNGKLVLSFVDTPFVFVSPTVRVPTRADLEAARRIVDGDSAVTFNRLGATFASGASMTRESALIFGLTDFVIARTRTELTAATLRQAQQWFARDTVLTKLFPSTAHLIANEAEGGQDVVTLLRVSGRKDFDVLPTALWKVVKARCVADTACTTSKRRGAVDAFRTGAALSESFLRRQSPIAAFTSLKTIDSKDFLTKGGRIGTRAAAVTAGEVAPGGGRRFADALGKETHAEYIAVFFAHDVLDKSDTILADTLRARLSLLADAASSMQNVYEEFDLLRESRSAALSVRRERYVALAQSFASAVADASAVGASFVTAEPATPYVEMLAVTANVASALVEEDYVTALALSITTAKSVGVNVSPNFMRWATFSARLASGKTPEDVSAALDQFALPPASYIAKRYPPVAARTSPVAIHVNSYLGVSGGGEWLTGNRGTITTSSKLAAFGGISLPVGVEFSIGASKTSLFFPVIDLGAVASYRIGDSKAETAPNVSFSNIIAPGVFLTTALSRDFPLSIGAGWQFAPRLRSLITGETRDASRLAVILAADVPLFRIR